MNGSEGPNQAVLEVVARRVRPLLADLVFVGGQATELYLTDPAAVRIRPTTDVDVVVATASRSEYRRIEERLRSLGFRNDTSEEAPICRWLSDDGHRLDLMPTDETVLGFSNPWYAAAVEFSEPYSLGVDLVIRIPQAPIFAATKLAAFQDRGAQDLLASPDLEDVISLVAGRPELHDEFQGQPEEIRAWTAEQVRELLAHPDFPYALQGALPDAARMPEYLQEVRRRFESLAELAAAD